MFDLFGYLTIRRLRERREESRLVAEYRAMTGMDRSTAERRAEALARAPLAPKRVIKVRR